MRYVKITASAVIQHYKIVCLKLLLISTNVLGMALDLIGMQNLVLVMDLVKTT